LNPRYLSRNVSWIAKMQGSLDDGIRAVPGFCLCARRPGANAFAFSITRASLRAAVALPEARAALDSTIGRLQKR
jgi:hypothetical protein